MNEPLNRPPVRNFNPERHTVLGELHRGKLKIEETHPLLKKMVRLAIFGNVGCLIGLWLSFRFKNLFPPHDAPFMTAIGWYFFFGAMYGVFAQSLFSYARFTETEAVIKAVTPNRRYEWHSRYDTSNMSSEDLKKVAKDPNKKLPDGKHEQSAATGAGGKIYFYSGVFALCAFGSCADGIYNVVSTLF